MTRTQPGHTPQRWAQDLNARSVSTRVESLGIRPGLARFEVPAIGHSPNLQGVGFGDATAASRAFAARLLVRARRIVCTRGTGLDERIRVHVDTEPAQGGGASKANQRDGVVPQLQYAIEFQRRP